MLSSYTVGNFSITAVMSNFLGRRSRMEDATSAMRSSRDMPAELDARGSSCCSVASMENAMPCADVISAFSCRPKISGAGVASSERM
jgi:hypothetical protein